MFMPVLGVIKGMHGFLIEDNVNKSLNINSTKKICIILKCLKIINGRLKSKGHNSYQ